MDNLKNSLYAQKARQKKLQGYIISIFVTTGTSFYLLILTLCFTAITAYITVIVVSTASLVLQTHCLWM